MRKITACLLKIICKPRALLKRGLTIESKGSIFYKSKVTINCGSNNHIDFKSSKLVKCNISIGGSNNYIVFGNSSNIHELNIIIEGNDNKVIIGDRTIIGGATDLICCYGSKVIIGSDSLFSKNIVIRTWDSHKIYTNGVWSNKPQDIVICNNVWLCERSSIFSGGYISDHSIVAFGAVVTKRFNESNVILGGVPANIIIRDISWER